jgi:hypothetical protein
MIDWKKYYSNFMKVSSINAGLFVAYRLYSHYRKNKLTYIEPDDYTPYLNQPYQVLDFTLHTNRLHALDFKSFEDDLGGYLISCFQYKNIYFSLVKYENLSEPHYTVNIDMGGCVDADKDPEDVCVQFINALDLNNIPVLWSNPELKNLFRNTKANKLVSTKK